MPISWDPFERARKLCRKRLLYKTAFQVDPISEGTKARLEAYRRPALANQGLRPEPNGLEAQGSISRTRNDMATIWGHRHGADPVGVGFESTDRLTGLQVPEPQRPVPGSRDERDGHRALPPRR